MKKILIILFSIFSFNCFSQQLDSIKHIEVISEIKDSMALINKTDIDKINHTFYKLRQVDSLNTINELIIEELLIKNEVMDSILNSQNVIIKNEKTINDHLLKEFNGEIDYYKKELKKANSKKIIWQSTTGISLLTILLILIL